MDVFGFGFATAFLVAAFTVFAILGRLLDTVAAGIGSTVAPTMVSGFRAWTPPPASIPGQGTTSRRTTDGTGGMPGLARTRDDGPIRVSSSP